MAGIWLVLLALATGTIIMIAYETIALTTRRVPTITEIVQWLILHFTPNELKPKVAAPTHLRGRRT